MRSKLLSATWVAVAALFVGAGADARDVAKARLSTYDRTVQADLQAKIAEGRQTFRFDTFGNEAFWGDALRLHEAIAGSENGGVGDGVSPNVALSVGLKVDVDALPKSLQGRIKAGRVDLDDPATTLALLELDAVVGVKGIFDASGNATVKAVLNSWGPGRFDALLDKDGKAFRPDGGQAGTLIPPAFGLAGVNLHTWTGFGSVPYWNAYVAVTEMHGSGTFFDARLSDPEQYPVAARTGSFDTRGTPDLVTPKLAALHVYQLALPAPKPAAGSFDAAAAERGKAIFAEHAKCASCHVPPLFTEPGNNLHAPDEIGVDSFQADRSPTHMYRTAPLAGLWTHQKGGFYHDGRFAMLRDVVEHYDTFLGLGLSEDQKSSLVEYLKSL